MKHLLLITILSLVFSGVCMGQANTNDFNDELIKLVIKYADGNVCQIFIPDDKKQEYYEADIKSTQPILVGKLLEMGFEIVASDYLGFCTENAAVKFTLKNKDCDCTVYRVYEYTKLEGRYKIKENIDCKKVVR